MKRRLSDCILAVLFPERCAFCGEVILPGTELCPACREEEQLRRILPPVCPFCGRETTNCICGRHQRLYERCVSAYNYCGAVRKGILRLKRYDKSDAFRFFADRMTEVIRREYGNTRFDGIVPVPLSRMVLKKRGYDPNLRLAQELSKRLSVPVTACLVKLYETRPQKELCARERSGNLLGVFDLNGDYSPEGRRFLLVDDVITTGSTLEECAKMLKIYGAVQVLAASAAATRGERETARKKDGGDGFGGNGSGT